MGLLHSRPFSSQWCQVSSRRSRLPPEVTLHSHTRATVCRQRARGYLALTQAY